VLAQPGVTRGPVDPRTGLPLTGWRRLLVRPLVEVRGDRWLTWLLDRCPWLGGRWCFALLAGFSALGGVILVAGAARLSRELPFLDMSRWRFWIIMVLVGNLVNALHEVGHAVASKAQGVRVLSVGLILDLPVLSGWTRPDRSFDQLSRRGRLVCVAAGPLCSFVCGTVALVGWALSVPGSAAASDWLTVTIAGVLGALISLVPFHKGDGYMLLAELTGARDLRRRAWRRLGALFGMSRALAPSEHRPWLAAFAAGMILWRVALTLGIVWLALQLPIFARPAT
jgi:hypothetical protein